MCVLLFFGYKYHCQGYWGKEGLGSGPHINLPLGCSRSSSKGQWPSGIVGTLIMGFRSLAGDLVGRYMDVSKNRGGPPKSSILTGFSNINFNERGIS